MPLTKNQIVKLAAEVLRRYEEKYGAAPIAPTVSVMGNTTRTNLGKGSAFSIKPSTTNPMGTKPMASQVMSPRGAGGLGGGSGGLSKGTGGKGANL